MSPREEKVAGMPGQKQKSQSRERQKQFPRGLWIFVSTVLLAILVFPITTIAILQRQGITQGTTILNIISIVVGIMLGFLGLMISVLQWLYPRQGEAEQHGLDRNGEQSFPVSVSEQPKQQRQSQRANKKISSKTPQLPQPTPTLSASFRYSRSFLFAGMLLSVVVSLIATLSLSLWFNAHPGWLPGVGPSSSPVTSRGPSECPPAGTARAAMISSLPLHNDPNIIYIENDDGGPSPINSMLKRYDVKTGVTTVIKQMPNSSVIFAQLSRDGQWILFTATGNGVDKLQLVRIDGQHLQTIYCTLQGGRIEFPQWSGDQKWIAFTIDSPNPVMGSMEVYLLNVTSGILEPEVLPSPGGIYSPLQWLDSSRLFMTASYTAPSCQCDCSVKVDILDINKGANQQENNLHSVIDKSRQVSISPSTDGKLLFVSRSACSDTVGLIGPSSISVQSVVDGKGSIIYNSPNFAIRDMQVVSSTLLLLLVINQKDISQDGLWKIKTDGSGLKQLTVDSAVASQFFNGSYTWSNVSRDSSMYALLVINQQDNSFSLLYGSINGGRPTIFDFAPDGKVPTIVGWTTM